MSARFPSARTNRLLAQYKHELDEGRCSAEMLGEMLELVTDTVQERTDDGACDARTAVAHAIIGALVENGHAGDVAAHLDQAAEDREGAAARYAASQAARTPAATRNVKATPEELREWLELAADLADLDRARFLELLGATRELVDKTRALQQPSKAPLVCLPGGLA